MVHIVPEEPGVVVQCFEKDVMSISQLRACTILKRLGYSLIQPKMLS